MSNRIVGVLLAFFLGGFGAHKFYTGNITLGFIYLIFCWTYIPCIIAFVEAIQYLCMTDKGFDEKYGKIPNSSSSAHNLAEWKSLLDSGAISQEEYDKKKAELI